MLDLENKSLYFLDKFMVTIKDVFFTLRNVVSRTLKHIG